MRFPYHFLARWTKSPPRINLYRSRWIQLLQDTIQPLNEIPPVAPHPNSSKASPTEANISANLRPQGKYHSIRTRDEYNLTTSTSPSSRTPRRASAAVSGDSSERPGKWDSCFLNHAQMAAGMRGRRELTHATCGWAVITRDCRGRRRPPYNCFFAMSARVPKYGG